MILQLQPLLTAALSLLVQRAQLQQCSIQTAPTNYSPVLDSLQCYNDYTTHIRCTWEEDQQLFSNQPIIRIPILNVGEQFCIRENDTRRLLNGKIQHSCISKNKIFFRGKHTLLFNASCPSQFTTFNVTAHGKVQTPLNLVERKINGGNRILSWSSPYSPSSPLTSKLIYQLRYRRHGQDWIVVDTKNVSELVIMKRDLLPGYLYRASVRARLENSVWSDWSPPVAWITKNENILNLQCVITEDGVLCSWQVHRENAQFFLYQLCWNSSENSVECKQCTDYTNHSESSVLEFTCSVKSLEPELLSVEIQSVHIEKSFSFPNNIQLPQPSPVKVHKQGDSWMLSWSRPDVYKSLKPTYQVNVQINGTQDRKESSHTASEFSLSLIASSLMPSTVYLVQVRAVPGQGYSGKPSEWSEPTYFTSDPAPWMDALIYILTGLIVVVCFTILYNVLLACQRNLQEWDVSIPSPMKSKVIDQIIIKTPAGMDNLYNEMGKKSPYILQTSDNPIIYNGSISECPVLPSSDDLDMGLSMMKSGYFHSLSQFSSFSHDNTVIDKSGMSFSGPYLLCRQNSSVPTETSDMSSLSSFDEVGHSDSTGKDNTSSVNVGYVFAPPTISPSSKHQPTLDEPITEHQEASQEELHVDSHSTYTVDPIPCQIFSHPSGYCLMPNKDLSVSPSGFASTPLAEGAPSWPSNEPEVGDPFERGYVTLSSRKKN